MVYVGLLLIVAGFILTNISGSFTKKFIRANNPDAHSYTGTQMKKEWEKVAREGGVVPSWVSLLSIGGWVVVFAGVVIIIRNFL